MAIMIAFPLASMSGQAPAAPAAWLPLLALPLALAASYLLAYPLQRLLHRHGVLDHPGPRSSHNVPVVRGGGLAMTVVILLPWLLAGLVMGNMVIVIAALAYLGLATVSFADDLRSLGTTPRLAVQAVCVLATLVSLRSLLPLAGLPWPLVALAWLVIFLWLAGYTNAFNFMDGIDGLAATQAALTGLASAGVLILTGRGADDPLLWLALVIAGAAAGFLPHNFPRPRMFMGDVGAAPLGFALAWLALAATARHDWHLLIVFACLHCNFVLDTGITLLRRIRRGACWHAAHREHFYQLLVRSGWSHRRTTLAEAALQCLCCAAALVAAARGGWAAASAAAVATGLLWISFFLFAEWRFRRGPSIA
jgi:UDP-N-acetylmuramyl pentapeptide phosphotransferase/UDP-N-acetylglucosamine-1-phosphate transferase